MGFDIALVETLNGGDIVFNGTDLVVVNNGENQPYLAMFGGNKESTPSNKADVPQNAQSFDFWGNNLFWASDQISQFNSKTERMLNDTELSSAGRMEIQKAMADDLQFLSPGGKVKVTVAITGPERIDASILITLPSGGQQVKIISFKKALTGDWVITDFNNDFLL
jgi:hypothetical protein